MYKGGGRCAITQRRAPALDRPLSNTDRRARARRLATSSVAGAASFSVAAAAGVVVVVGVWGKR